MKSAQQQFQLRNVKRRRRAAAEINRRWEEERRVSGGRRDPTSSSSQERLTKSRGLRAIQQIFVKRAIRTNPRAEGDVNVDVANLLLCHSERSRGIAVANLHQRTGSFAASLTDAGDQPRSCDSRRYS